MTTGGVELEPAYLLHSRPYQETSLILEVLGAQHGRTGLVARGARRPRSTWRSILQPFTPLRLSWSGRGALHTLRAAEPAGHEPPLTGLALMSAWYVNELLICLVRRGDPHPTLFGLYAATLGELRRTTEPEPALRRFELGLLAELGYGLSLEHEAVTGQALLPTATYRYEIEHGPVRCPAEAQGAFTGSELLAVARADFGDRAALLAARRLLRPVLDHYLAGRRLRTRDVLAAMRR